MVMVHCFMQPGQTPPVSNVFQECRQSHIQRFSGSGSHPQSGQRMRPLSPEPLSVVSISGRTGAGVARIAESMLTSGGESCQIDRIAQLATKRSATEFMQKRNPVGAGPSLNTC